MIKYIIIGFLLIISISLLAQDHTVLYLNSIGVFSAQAIYLTYTSLTTLADRYDLGDFGDDEAVQEVEVYIKFARQSSDELEKLLNQGAVSGEDIAFLNDMAAGFDLLSAEANSLKSFINTDQQEHMDNFEKNRTSAWDKISKLLDIPIPDGE